VTPHHLNGRYPNVVPATALSVAGATRRPGSRRSSPKRVIISSPLRALRAITVLTAVGALLIGCSSTPQPPPSTPGAALALEHIHGLSVAPDGRELTVATHDGIFRIDLTDPDTIEGPLGGVVIDAMGYTATTDVAYASGHPSPTEPSYLTEPNLGLIKSVDDGATWTEVSLGGEADFHALTIHPTDTNRIYGLDSQALEVMRSDDGGTTWKKGAQVLARDILVSPTDPDRVYVTTTDGIAVSTDGAASFTVDEAMPRLFLLAADPAREGRLVGVEDNGAIWYQTDSGEWVAGGSIEGPAQAITVDPTGQRFFAADDRGISVTSDFGATWRPVWER
jgi:hypothetical protein